MSGTGEFIPYSSRRPRDIELTHTSEGSLTTGITDTFTVVHRMPSSSVMTNYLPLWRPDNRYPGDLQVERSEHGKVRLRFNGLRHGAKDRLVCEIDDNAADKLMLILLHMQLATRNRA